ncbi:hypothetical protein EJB05_55965, partial [Eragrostis curvula]
MAPRVSPLLPVEDQSGISEIKSVVRKLQFEEDSDEDASLSFGTEQALSPPVGPVVVDIEDLLDRSTPRGRQRNTEKGASPRRLLRFQPPQRDFSRRLGAQNWAAKNQISNPRVFSSESNLTEGPQEQDEAEEGEVEDLFGQLWLIPNDSPKARVSRVPPPQLFWIRKGLIGTRKLVWEDCHPVGAADRYVSKPILLNFARDFWAGDSRKPSFLQAVKSSMGERGRGSGSQNWRAGGRGNAGRGNNYGGGNGRQQQNFGHEQQNFGHEQQQQFNPYQNPNPFYGFYPPPGPQFPPPPFYPPHPGMMHPMPPPQQQFQMQQQPPPQQNYQENQQRAAPKPAQKVEGQKKKPEVKPAVTPRYVNVVCYNCGGPGHYIHDCKLPKLCFICSKTGHASHDCEEWYKQQINAEYLGNASPDLGFYHIEMEESEEEIKKQHWLNFTNCGVVCVAAGKLTKEELVKELAATFDDKWPWQVRQIDEFNFLVRFPPQKKVADLADLAYFPLKTEGIEVSLTVWHGEGFHTSVLQEVWVQVKGIPPKWCKWKLINQVASRLGMLIDIDWQSLLGSFYDMIRLKVAVTDPKKIPNKMLIEVKKAIYEISFKVDTDVSKVESNSKGDPGQGDDDDDECDDLDEEKKEDKMDTDLSNTPTEQQDKVKDNGKKESKGKGSGNVKGSKTCTQELYVNNFSLLRDLEMIHYDADEEEQGEIVQQATIISLDMEEEAELPLLEDCQKPETAMMADNKRKIEKQWGPVMAKRTSARTRGDNRTTIEKAQQVQQRKNLETHSSESAKGDLQLYQEALATIIRRPERIANVPVW